jgi:hypothetical protein
MLGLALVGSGGIGFILCAVLAVILPFTAIRVTDLAGSALTLTGVNDIFCEAVCKRRKKETRSTAPFETSAYDDLLRARRERRHRQCDRDDD